MVSWKQMLPIPLFACTLLLFFEFLLCNIVFSQKLPKKEEIARFFQWFLLQIFVQKNHLNTIFSKQIVGIFERCDVIREHSIRIQRNDFFDIILLFVADILNFVLLN